MSNSSYITYQPLCHQLNADCHTDVFSVAGLLKRKRMCNPLLAVFRIHRKETAKEENER